MPEETAVTKYAAEQEELQRALIFTQRGLDAPRFVRTLIFLSLAMLFLRPQQEFPVIGEMKIPLVLTVLPLIFWLPKWKSNWTKQTMCLIGILGLGALLGPIARNTHWAFHSWLDLMSISLCFVFPIAVFFASGRRLRHIIYCLTLLGVYLAVYGMLHKGYGPGGFLNDENDLCLTLLLFLPLPILILPHMRSFVGKIAMGAGGAAILGGIVVTVSRGGFVGLILAVAWMSWKSKTKAITFFIALCLAAGLALLAPKEYWSEMATISQTSSGTAKQRFEYWGVAIKAWVSPRHFLIGSGMGNTPFVIGDYEPEENKLPTGKSIAGRQVHSLYFQLLLELGLVGALLFFLAVWYSCSGNSAATKRFKQYKHKLRLLTNALQQQEMELDRPEMAAAGRQKKRLCAMLEAECGFILGVSSALSASWIGVLASAAFLSVLYYPPIWILVGLSTALQMYTKKLDRLLEHYLETALVSQ